MVASKRRLGWQTQQKPECWVTTQPTSADPTQLAINYKTWYLRF